MMRRAGMSAVRPAVTPGSPVSLADRSLHTGQPRRAMKSAAGIRPIPALPPARPVAGVPGHPAPFPFPDPAPRARSLVRAGDRVRHLPPKE